jgi:pimeloyl-ACP methyl ester carboxylesterase
MLGYDELLHELPRPEGPFVIVAESFSGPLALKLAAQTPLGLRAVILVATFVRCPVRVPRMVAPLVRPGWFRAPPPAWVVRRQLVGADASDALVFAVQRANASVHPEVLAGRLREVIRVDASQELRRCSVPIFYLAGRQDRVVRRFNVEGMKRIRPSLEIAELDSPHLVLQCQPKASAEQTARWLAQL